jgi:hypothetical protein
MNRPLTRDDLLDVLELALKGQLSALRASRRAQAGIARRGPRAGKRSNIAIVKDILEAAGQPLHINEIIAIAHRDHGVEFKRESIVSALAKKVLDRNLFRRAGRNVFGLLGAEED